MDELSSSSSSIYEDLEPESEEESESESDTDSEAQNPRPNWYNPQPLFVPPVTSSLSSTAPFPVLHFDSDSDTDSDSDSEPDMNSLVTDLFANRSDTSQSSDEQGYIWDLVFESPHGDNDGVFSSRSGNVGEFGHRRIEFSGASRNDQSVGLRVVGNDSDSDTDRGIIDFAYGVNDGNSEIGVVENSDVDPWWGNFRLDDREAGYDWEQITGRMNPRQSTANSIQEVSISSGLSEDLDPGEENIRDLEWQILFAVNSLERSIVVERGLDSDSYLAVVDDYMHGTGYDALFDQIVENEVAHKGSPPAAKWAVDNLPLVQLTKEEFKGGTVVCAVCKDDILLGEKVRRMPCCHCYHGDCIMPWLAIRNTCPICRYELPTDDLEYELRKSQSGSEMRSVEVGYDSEQFG